MFSLKFQVNRRLLENRFKDEKWPWLRRNYGVSRITIRSCTIMVSVKKTCYLKLYLCKSDYLGLSVNITSLSTPSVISLLCWFQQMCLSGGSLHELISNELSIFSTFWKRGIGLARRFDIRSLGSCFSTRKQYMIFLRDLTVMKPKQTRF